MKKEREETLQKEREERSELKKERERKKMEMKKIRKQLGKDPLNKWNFFRKDKTNNKGRFIRPSIAPRLETIEEEEAEELIHEIMEGNKLLHRMLEEKTREKETMKRDTIVNMMREVDILREEKLSIIAVDATYRVSDGQRKIVDNTRRPWSTMTRPGIAPTPRKGSCLKANNRRTHLRNILGNSLSSRTQIRIMRALVRGVEHKEQI